MCLSLVVYFIIFKFPFYVRIDINNNSSGDEDNQLRKFQTFSSDLLDDPYEMRINTQNSKSAQKQKEINRWKTFLLRKFLLLFVISAEIDHYLICEYQKNYSNGNKKNGKSYNEHMHRNIDSGSLADIRASRKNSRNKSNSHAKSSIEPERIFDASLFWWFVRSIYYWQHASIPYILALFRDEVDVVGLDSLWRSIQLSVKSVTDFSQFSYLAPFINFFDAIDCFLRSTESKRYIS